MADEKDNVPVKPETWYAKANLAIEGILYTARTQKHMRWHFVTAAVVTLLGLFLGLDRISFIALTLAVVTVLVAEVFNTAVEAAVDLTCGVYHPMAKVAKDTAAGAVFIAAVGSAVIGFLILYPYVAQLIAYGVPRVKLAGENVAFMALVFVVIAVILVKSYFGRGEPLTGGLPSGHAAVSTGIAVASVFLTHNALVFLLALMLAVMVSHSRVAMGIHSVREVVLGALLGGLITLLIFFLFG